MLSFVLSKKFHMYLHSVYPVNPLDKKLDGRHLYRGKSFLLRKAYTKYKLHARGRNGWTLIRVTQVLSYLAN